MTKPAQDSDLSSARNSGNVPPVVAANVRRLRLQKGHSLEQLALSSGVERNTLELLEAGGHEPTIKTLWSLATALSVPFSALIAPDSEGGQPRRDSTPPSGAKSRKVLGARGGAGQSEVYELKLAAHATETAAPRSAGAQENVLVTSGVAAIDVAGQRYTLQT